CKMGKRVPGRRRRHSVDQPFRITQIGSDRLANLFQYALSERDHQQSLRIDRLGIECQRIFEEPYRFRESLWCRTFMMVERSPSAKNVIKSVRIFGWPCRLRAYQFQIERDGDLARHLVLQFEQIVRSLVETL